MTASVLFVQMSMFEKSYPLVAGNLTAYALSNPILAEAYEFDSVDFTTSTPIDQMVEHLLSKPRDVFALSCYVWNMAAMRKIAAAIRAHFPEATIVMGGPEVINEGPNLITPGDTQTVVCNGEGERVFSNLLLALHAGNGLSDVPGIALWSGDKVVTNPGEPRIKDLNDIPSPILTGLYPGRYDVHIFETNRGCPFSCSFCFWGAATNDKVQKFDETRVRDEITQISKNRVPRIFLADANWGMQKRDVDLTRHIIACKQQNSAPLGLLFSSSKNSPARVAEITQMLADNNMINTQTVSMQSLNEQTLTTIDRKNISIDAYLELQSDLNARKIGSFIELIWPLPGETLDGLLEGWAHLFRNNARTLVVYGNTLLKNTPMRRDRDALGIKTRRVSSEISEEEFIIATHDASEADVRMGRICIMAMQALFNAKTAVTLMAYLDRTDQMTYPKFLRAFAEFLHDHPTADISSFVRDTIDNDRLSEFGNSTDYSFLILHKKRAEFTRILQEFCAQFDWWQDPDARLCFELDLIQKPYFFDNTMPEYLSHTLEFLSPQSSDMKMRALTVSLSQPLPPAVAGMLPGQLGHNSAVTTLEVAHPKLGSSYSSSWARQELFHYGNGFLTNVDKSAPSITAGALETL